jgi:hypothetical protein
MDKAWKEIMRRLAGVATGRAAPATLAGLGPAPLAAGIVQEFFANLGGAGLVVDFISREARGGVARFRAADLDLTPVGPAPAMAIDGSISIGVNIRF